MGFDLKVINPIRELILPTKVQAPAMQRIGPKVPGGGVVCKPILGISFMPVCNVDLFRVFQIFQKCLVLVPSF